MFVYRTSGVHHGKILRPKVQYIKWLQKLVPSHTYIYICLILFLFAYLKNRLACLLYGFSIALLKCEGHVIWLARAFGLVLIFRVEKAFGVQHWILRLFGPFSQAVKAFFATNPWHKVTKSYMISFNQARHLLLNLICVRIKGARDVGYMFLSIILVIIQAFI